MNWFYEMNPVMQSLIAGIFTFSITALGAFVVCFFKECNKKVLDTVLGFSAGVMIAASFWSLLTPSIDLSTTLGYSAWLFPSLGFIFGGLFVLISDKIVDVVMDKKEITNKVSLKRKILLVSAVTIHNIPEGLSLGVAFGGLALNIEGLSALGAIMLAIGIGIQNFPEGASVSLPLRSEGVSRFKSFLIGALSAIVEPISAVIGAILVSKIRSFLPFLLSFAAGAMIIVVARELLPESIRENKNLSTIGLILGFIIMMILDLAFIN